MAGNIIPQKVNNYTAKDLMNSEGDATPQFSSLKE
jgi:hypothetical protein